MSGSVSIYLSNCVPGSPGDGSICVSRWKPDCEKEKAVEPAVHVVNMMIVSPSVCKGDNLGGGKLREVPSVCQRENPSVHEVGEQSV